MNLSILEPGLSFIIRSKNEEENTFNCLESLRSIYENNNNIEIIFVDNMSTDNTLSIAEQFSKKYSNVKTYSYNHIVPRCGSEHQKSVLNMCTNTLETYYNWCLDKATKYNIIKWDGDFIANIENLKIMIKEYDLETRNDHIMLWCTGQTIFMHEKNTYIKKESYYDEFRVFSKINGFKWENTPDGVCETCAYEYSSKLPSLPHHDSHYNGIYAKYIDSITNNDNFNNNDFINFLNKNDCQYIAERINIDENNPSNSTKYFKIIDKNITHNYKISQTGISLIPGYKYAFDNPVFYEIKMTSKNEFESRSNLIDIRDNDDYIILRDLKNNIINDKIEKVNNIICN